MLKMQLESIVVRLPVVKIVSNPTVLIRIRQSCSANVVGSEVVISGQPISAAPYVGCTKYIPWRQLLLQLHVILLNPTMLIVDIDCSASDVRGSFRMIVVVDFCLVRQW